MSLIAIALIVMFAPCRAAGLSDLKQVESWQNVARGVWSVVLGDMQSSTHSN